MSERRSVAMASFSAGQAVLTTVLFLLFISGALLFSFASVALKETNAARLDVKGKQSYFLAEAGVEDLVWRIKNGKQYAPQQTLTLNGSNATIDVVTTGSQKTVRSQGSVSSAVRSVRTVLKAASVGVSFVYGVQVGDFGLEMEESSKVTGSGGAAGNVYSNGPIAGDNGATITGDATVATTTASLDEVTVLGTARAKAITSSDICGDAYYQSIDASSLSFLNNPGSTCSPKTPGTGYPGSPVPPAQPPPISDATIQQWKADAAAGGTIIGNCGDDGVAGCNIPSNGSLLLGPKKIIGGLTLTKKQTLIVTGTLHFTGTIDLDSTNGAAVKCDPLFGSDSCIVIADGWIHIRNNATFQGSGSAGSYIIVLTTLAGCYGSGHTRSDILASCTHHAGGVDFHNNATGAIFYAANSMVYLHNGVNLTELTAGKIHLDNNATVTYEQGLADVHFISGPTGGWNIQSWNEVK